MASLTRRILFVDEGQSDTQLAHTALRARAQEYVVEIVDDGAAALDFLYRRGKFENSTQILPALILLGLRTTGLDGFEVLRIVKRDENLKNIPIVVYSSSQSGADIETCYRLGANAFVIKPAKMDDVSSTIQAICDFWLRTNLVP
jgi:CheY-like chemotaxis protein